MIASMRERAVIGAVIALVMCLAASLRFAASFYLGYLGLSYALVRLHEHLDGRRLPRASVREGTHSHFLLRVFGIDGELKHVSPWHHNLTTDTASGYTNRRDWQAKAMGGGLGAFFSATCQGTATASGATSLTNSGASFPTTAQGLAGQWVAVGANSSGVGSFVLGYILSNTGTALTVDQWYNATGGLGTTPNATGQYFVIPGQAPAMALAVTSDATTPTSADTTLTSEATSNGFARALATWSHTAAATTYALTHTYTASGSLTVNKEANVGGLTALNGVMPFESAVGSPPVMISGDTLALTDTITIN